MEDFEDTFDIFISYRRTDMDVASAVLKAIAGYPYFKDDGIRAGENWPEAIRQAARRCKVFLAVVGNRWVAERRRFEDPSDWVRQELEIVLGRPEDQVVVIPILFNVSPEEVLSKVTAEQGPFARLFRQEPAVLPAAHALNQRLFNTHQMKRLVEHEREILASIEQALKPAPIELQRLPQPLVPYLCDRDKAERKIKERFERKPRPDFVVVHGYDREVHARFIDRLAANGELEKLFSSRLGVEVRPLPWGHEAPGEGGFAEVMEFALEKQLVGSDPSRTLAGALRAVPRPQIFTIEVTWTDRDKLGANLIAELLSAFRNTISRLAPESAGRMLLWINVTYDRPDGQDLTEEEVKALEPLPRLEPVELVHFKEWIALPEVKTYVPDKDRTKFEDAIRFRFADKPLHMLDFALAVEKARAQSGG